MNIHAACFSPTGTSKTIVSHIAKSISMNYTLHDFTLANKRKSSLTFNEDDCLILGLPVYAGRIPLIVEDYVKRIKGSKTLAVIVVLYGNRDYDDALIEMYDILSENGFHPIAGAAFIGEHSYTDQVAHSRPNSNDLEICHKFAKNILPLLEKDPLGFKLSLKGNRPYRERTISKALGPIVNENCFKCRLCIGKCPVGALSLNNSIQVDETICIKCHACVKSCPVDAINFDERLEPVRKWLIDEHSSPKSLELFLGKER